MSMGRVCNSCNKVMDRILDESWVLMYKPIGHWKANFEEYDVFDICMDCAKKIGIGEPIKKQVNQ